MYFRTKIQRPHFFILIPVSEKKIKWPKNTQTANISYVKCYHFQTAHYFWINQPDTSILIYKFKEHLLFDKLASRATIKTCQSQYLSLIACQCLQSRRRLTGKASILTLLSFLVPPLMLDMIRMILVYKFSERLHEMQLLGVNIYAWIGNIFLLFPAFLILNSFINPSFMSFIKEHYLWCWTYLNISFNISRTTFGSRLTSVHSHLGQLLHTVPPPLPSALLACSHTYHTSYDYVTMLREHEQNCTNFVAYLESFLSRYSTLTWMDL